MSLNAGMMSSERGDWETPQDFFDRVNAIFDLELDAAATYGNAKCLRYLSERALDLDWSALATRIWLNPPYGRGIGAWVRHARNEWAVQASTVVCLLPARTDTRWFQDCWEARYLLFIKGRLKFGGCDQSAPFPSVLAVFTSQTWDMGALSDLGTIITPTLRSNTGSKLASTVPA